MMSNPVDFEEVELSYPVDPEEVELSYVWLHGIDPPPQEDLALKIANVGAWRTPDDITEVDGMWYYNEKTGTVKPCEGYRESDDGLIDELVEMAELGILGHVIVVDQWHDSTKYVLGREDGHAVVSSHECYKKLYRVTPQVTYQRDKDGEIVEIGGKSKELW